MSDDAKFDNENNSPEKGGERRLPTWSVAFLVCAGAALVAWGLPWVFVDRPGAQVSSLILVVGGVYFGFLKKMPQHVGGLWWRRGLGLAFLVAGFLIPWSDRPEADMPWQPYDGSLLSQAQKEGKPVMIDFTAAWCGPCQIMENQVFSRKRIVAEAERFVTLKADLTDSGDPGVQALAEKFSIVAFPTVVFIGPDGNERTNLRLVGLEWADRFEKRMMAVQ
jgi:thiol:disulfide interchange protein DsbD